MIQCHARLRVLLISFCHIIFTNCNSSNKTSENSDLMRPKCAMEAHPEWYNDGSKRRIYGGIPAEDNEYKWTALFSKLSGYGLTCGATLIAPKYGMTACHCILNGGNTGYKSAGSRGSSQV